MIQQTPFIKTKVILHKLFGQELVGWSKMS